MVRVGCWQSNDYLSPKLAHEEVSRNEKVAPCDRLGVRSSRQYLRAVTAQCSES